VGLTGRGLPWFISAIEVEVEMGMEKVKHEIEGFRVIGRRAYVVRSDEVFLAARGRWELSEFLNWRSDRWVSLKLFDTHSQARKRVYQLGYGVKDRRLAVNANLYDLSKRYPEITDWVLDTMRELHASGVLDANLAGKRVEQ